MNMITEDDSNDNNYGSFNINDNYSSFDINDNTDSHDWRAGEGGEENGQSDRGGLHGN